MRLPIAFFLLVLPILEIATFVVIGSEIGVIATIALVIATTIAGAALLRIQGLGTLARIRAQLDSGQVPDRELVHGVMILLAGLLLITPGFITDVLGMLLFVPAIRELAWRFQRERITVIVRGQTFSGYHRPHDEPRVIELDSSEFSRRERPPGD